MRPSTRHMSPPPFDPARPYLARPVRLDPAGVVGPTPAQARSARWRRTTRGFYVPADINSHLPEQRIVEAAHFLSPASAVTGWASLCWQGARWFDGRADGGRSELDVVVTTIRNAVRSRPGLAVTSECIPPRDRLEVDGLRVVTPVCAVAYEMRYADSLVAAVRAFDMAAAADLVSVDELMRHLELLYHWTGIPQAREAALLVDENAWSPPEVDVRLTWPLELGLDPPLTNRPLFDREGRHVATPDLLDVEAGLVVEYDGPVHLTADRRARDLSREDDLRGLGLEYLVLVGADRADRARMARRIRAARTRSPFTPAADRRWTFEPPGLWTPTTTVEQRRALSLEERERFLRYRRTG